MKDGVNSANRYYLNRFRDAYRQAVIGKDKTSVKLNYCVCSEASWLYLWLLFLCASSVCLCVYIDIYTYTYISILIYIYISVISVQ